MTKTNNINGISFEQEVEIIFRLLKEGEYPAGTSLNIKRSLRRRAEVFTLNADATSLIFKGRSGKEKRKVITGRDEQRRKISRIHEDAAGNYN